MTRPPSLPTPSVMAEGQQSPAVRLIRFVRFLRQQGFEIGVQETLDSLRIAAWCGTLDQSCLQEGLRSLLCQSRDDWRRFDTLFEHFWYPQRVAARMARSRDPRIPRQVRTVGHTGLSHAVELDLTSSESETGQGGAGRHKALARSDFRFLADRHAMQEMQRFAENLARRIRLRLNRRYRILHHGRKIHIRRTLRKSLAYGGLPLVLAYQERRRQWPRFVLLLDISHSMASYAPLLTRFLRGLVLTFRDAEAFMFHTRLYRVTDLFRQTDADALQRRFEAMTPLWFGGTRIADSLHRFNRRFGHRIANSRTIFIILSDGFDADAPELLVDELQVLRRRADKILWLNPMLGQQGYLPDDDTMAAARPLLDLLAPAHSVASLETVANYLARL